MTTTIKIYLRSKTHKQALRDAVPATFHNEVEWIYPDSKSQIPASADLVVHPAKGAPEAKHHFFAADHGCNILYCLPEASEVFQARLADLVAHGSPNGVGAQAPIPTVIVDASLVKELRQ